MGQYTRDVLFNSTENTKEPYGSRSDWQRELSKAFINRKPEFDESEVQDFITRLHSRMPIIMDMAESSVKLSNSEIDLIINRLNKTASSLQMLNGLIAQHPFFQQDFYRLFIDNPLLETEKLAHACKDLIPTFEQRRKKKTGPDIRLQKNICRGIQDHYIIVFKTFPTARVEATQTPFEAVCESIEQFIDVKITQSNCRAAIESWAGPKAD